MIKNEKGIFRTILFDDNSDWNDVFRLAQPHLDAAGLRRLSSALDAATKAVVVERHYIDKDYRDTFSNYHSKKFNTLDARCVRLHFFGTHWGALGLAKGAPVERDYLGYCVVRPTRPNCIGRTLLRPEARIGLRGHLTLCSEQVYIQGIELSLTGFPFISQDGDATACAQATLWMLMRYYSNRYPAYPEVYPVQIGQLTRDYSVGRLLPTTGLYVWQMAEALRQVGFAPVIYGKHRYRLAHLLYTYIESGIPVLAAFGQHVVVLFGHQSDYATTSIAEPAAEGTFVWSSDFNRAFVGNDDNGIPYQVLREVPLGIEGEEMGNGSQQYRIDDIEQFVVPLPERVYLTAEHMQPLLREILLGEEFGYLRFSPRLASATPILRVFLTTGRAFKKRLWQRANMGHPNVVAAYRELPLPHFIWVCEISQSSLYPHSVLGEVLWDATRNPHEHNGFLAIHYPEILILDQGSALNRAPNLLELRLDGGEAYPIFRHNLREGTV